MQKGMSILNRIVVAADSDLIAIAPGEEVSETTRETAHAAASLLELADHIIFAHGGRAQTELVRSVMERAHEAGLTPAPPLDADIARSAGYLGFHVEQVLSSEMETLGHADLLPTAAMLTLVHPISDGGLPQVLETNAIRVLSDKTPMLIAGGCGGIPVRRTRGEVEGEDVFCDLYLTAASIAHDTEADCLVVLLPGGTELPKGPLTPANAQNMSRTETADSAIGRALHAAALYVTGGKGRRAVISTPDSAASAVSGPGGLTITES